MGAPVVVVVVLVAGGTEEEEEEAGVPVERKILEDLSAGLLVLLRSV